MLPVLRLAPHYLPQCHYGFGCFRKSARPPFSPSSDGFIFMVVVITSLKLTARKIQIATLPPPPTSLVLLL
ncbi:hypothetical protein B0H11DRAFT_2252640 [Mycena galericulata]|nr:hypothetical protein B0H11DRAFT_2252640 [Mycena galericulata]